MAETPKPSTRPNRTTADDVARAAGVSRVAVSRAFNPKASLKQEKRENILRIARDLNYTPDMAARALATRRSHLVGVIIPDVFSPWESQEIDALTALLQAEGFATILFKTSADQSIDPQLLTYMHGFNLDSIIVFAEVVRPELITHHLGQAVPIYVTYNEPVPPEPGKGPLFDRLNIEQQTGIDQAVALMQAYGGKRFAYIGGQPWSLSNSERERSFRNALENRGLDAPIIVPGDYTYDTAYAATLDLFRVGDGADAIFAVNDVGAFGVLDALRHELGLNVPKDVKLVGFDDITQSSWKAYDLTTVKIDVTERVRALVRLMQRRLKSPDAPAMVETIQTSLVIRGTVA